MLNSCSAIHRMETRVRQTYKPPVSETVHFKCRLDDGVGGPPPRHVTGRDVVWNSDISTSLYEEIAQPSFVMTYRDRHKWKDFEHYKVFSSDPSVSLARKQVYAECDDLYPHTSIGECKQPLFGYPWPGFTGLSQGTIGFGDPGRPTLGLPGFYSKRLDGGFVPAPDDLDKLEGMALRLWTPKIKNELSIINSIWELRDFSSLPNTLRNIWSTLGRNLFRPRANQTLRQTLRATSDGYLQSQFNILPLLSDIVGLRRALSRIQSQINDLVTRSGRVQHMHFAYNWREFEDQVDADDPFYIWPQNMLPGQISRFVNTRTTYHQPSQFHAEIEFNFNFTQYQIENALLYSIHDALGINLNPRIIWNAIPWSFVIDWVVGVGRWLDRFKVTNMEPTINIRKYLWSIKRSRRVYITVNAKHYNETYPGHSGYPQEAPIPVVTETAYRRQTGLPKLSSLQASGLDSQEITLGAALVLARRRRR